LSNDELTLFSYEILGLVGRGGAGAHDLKQLVRKGRFLAWAGESQYYAEPKRLARLGYLDARKEPGKTRERTVYTLTDKGLAALREWGRTPLRFTPLKSEAALRLLAADIVGEEATRESFTGLRQDLDDLQKRVEEMSESAQLLPHRRKYLLLVVAFLERVIEAYEQLIADVERELAP
jgi:PadR family transcriptional regulator, regulatory protein AphA